MQLALPVSIDAISASRQATSAAPVRAGPSAQSFAAWPRCAPRHCEAHRRRAKPHRRPAAQARHFDGAWLSIVLASLRLRGKAGADPARAVVHDGAHDRWCVHRERAAGDESTDSERELQNTAAAVFGYSNRVAQSGWHNVHRMKTNATSARK